MSIDVDSEPKDYSEQTTTQSNKAQEGSTPPSSLSALRPQRLFIVLLFACFGIILIRSFVISFCMVPTSSMEPTLLPGDYVVINKVPTQFNRLVAALSASTSDQKIHSSDLVDTGTVIAFWQHNPGNASTDPNVFVKRVAARAGDRLDVVASRLSITKQSTSDSPDVNLVLRARRRLVSDGGVVPYASQRIELSAENAETWREIIEKEGNSLLVSQGIVYINSNAVPDYTLKNNYYLVLGDNSADSYDSRYFGYVSEQDLIGYVSFVYWSKSTEDNQGQSSIRWNRIACAVH